MRVRGGVHRVTVRWTLCCDDYDDDYDVDVVVGGDVLAMYFPPPWNPAHGHKRQATKCPAGRKTSPPSNTCAAVPVLL